MATNFLIFLIVYPLLLSFGKSSNAMTISSSNVTCIHGERRSLITFKKSLTNGLNRLSTWTGLECCKWQGVECDSQNGHVTKLDLRNPYINDVNWLGGELSPSLLNLTNLRYLDLSMNNFSGQIPEFLGSFKRLEYVNLSCSGFGGKVPPHLGNLSRLQYLDLNYIIERNRIRDRYNGPELHSYDLSWVSSLTSLKHLDLSGVIIGWNYLNWLPSVNMIPSLVTLNMAFCRINLPSVKFSNLTSLKSLDLSTNVIDTAVPVWLSNLTSLVHLNLQRNFFHGRIPDSIGTLSSLASIDLSVNSFNALMPRVLMKMSGLVYLDLSNNKFYGSVPTDVKLCNLSVLNLSFNEFEGDLSNFIGNAFDCSFASLSSSLRDLDISFNKLNGSIPDTFGLLSRLEKLDLSVNRLIGNIPTSLMQLSRLEKLDVSYNSLLGNLSQLDFNKLENLTFLDLSSTSLALSFSSRWVPPFQLWRLSLGSCNIGPSFPNWLQTQENLQVLDLSNSSIIDTIPDWFENISSNIYDLDLSHNQISGKLPRFQGSSNLSGSFRKSISMNSNKFEGSFTSLLSNMKLLDLSDNLLSGHVPRIDQTTNPDLSVVNLSKNRFTGSISLHFCKLLSLRVLDLSQNQFSGKLPHCIGYLNRLAVMDLSNNTITSVIPSSLGRLEDLRSLHLQNNRFIGNLPVSLQNLTLLDFIDLSNNFLTGDVPSWIGENLFALGILNLQSNKFTGRIPIQLCRLDMLQFLDLAQNDITGMIPRCFGSLTGMIRVKNYLMYTDEYYDENVEASMKGRQLLYTKTVDLLTSLDLSSNKIFGEIPDDLMNLAGLRNLNLSRNLLTGKIPMTVRNLKQVESLDLSMNKLFGPIPQSLSSLYSLSHLNLSFNNLSGAIPSGNQIQTLNDPSMYEGNSGLCGPPLSRSCKSNNGSHSHTGGNEGEEDGHERLWFYAGMGPGFFVGFMGLVGSLHFIRGWRMAYFRILEIIYNWLMLSILLNLARVKRKLF